MQHYNLYRPVIQKENSSVSQFRTGRRNIGAWLSAFAFAYIFSAVIFVGYAGQFGWKFGLGNLDWNRKRSYRQPFPPGCCSTRTRIMTTSGSATMPDFFETLRQQNLKLAASVGLLYYDPYTASLYNGLSRNFRHGFNIELLHMHSSHGCSDAVYVIAGDIWQPP